MMQRYLNLTTTMDDKFYQLGKVFKYISVKLQSGKVEVYLF